jgi:hypothetical protein
MLIKHLFPALLTLVAVEGTAAAATHHPEITPAPVLVMRSPVAAPDAQYYTPPTTTRSLFSINETSLRERLPKPTCTQTITPDKNGYVPPGTCNSNYLYYPSYTAAVALAVVFGFIAFLHTTQAVLYKKSSCWVVIMGALWEFVGYVTRSASTKNQQSTGLVFVSQILILLSPVCTNIVPFMRFLFANNNQGSTRLTI